MCLLATRSAAACKRTCAVARVGGAATGADSRVAAGWDDNHELPTVLPPLEWPLLSADIAAGPIVLGTGMARPWSGYRSVGFNMSCVWSNGMIAQQSPGLTSKTQLDLCWVTTLLERGGCPDLR